MHKAILFTIVAVLIGSAFYGGMRYEASRQPSFSGGPMMTQGSNGKIVNLGGGEQAGTFISGSVLSVDETSFTMQLPQGGSRVVLFGSTTPITKSTGGTIEDIQAGETVTVTGRANDDGSISTQSIQIGGQLQRTQGQ
jgi:hypothetical protein